MEKADFYIIKAYLTQLGTYGTKKKALKVLDMIQDAYEHECYCKKTFDYGAEVTRPFLNMNNTVYQMPQDNKVEV